MTKMTRQQLEAMEDDLIRRYADLPETATAGDAENLRELIAFVQVALMQGAHS